MKHVGLCAICGVCGDLTFEHIPPQAAFNKGRITVSKEHANQHFLDDIKGKYVQRGAGAHTLCEKCNSDTGTWYVKEYIKWARTAAALLERSSNEPSASYYYSGYPCRFFKQVLTMIVSVVGAHFTARHQWLRHYLLCKSSRYYDRSIRVYAYYNPSTRWRNNSSAALMNAGLQTPVSVFSELAAFPFGFVLTEDGPPPDSRMVEITYFSDYEYDDITHVPLRLPSFPVVSYLPGIYYRTSEVMQMRKPDDPEGLGFGDFWYISDN